MISEFTLRVIQIVLSIPKGQVATYKQIAELAGKPQASRGVSWILHSCSTRYQLPWHRVINSKGKISFDPMSVHYRRQKKRLETEGVELSETHEINLKKYLFKPKKKRSSHRTQLLANKNKRPSRQRKNSFSRPQSFSK